MNPANHTITEGYHTGQAQFPLGESMLTAPQPFFPPYANSLDKLNQTLKSDFNPVEKKISVTPLSTQTYFQPFSIISSQKHNHLKIHKISVPDLYI